MLARLVALDEGPDIPVDRCPVLVGRHPRCDARIDAIGVSRHHCVLAEDRGQLVVRDLGSRNGVRVNGVRVESGLLRPGDELMIDRLRYQVCEGRAHEPIRVWESGGGGPAHSSPTRPGRVPADALPPAVPVPEDHPRRPRAPDTARSVRVLGQNAQSRGVRAEPLADRSAAGL